MLRIGYSATHNPWVRVTHEGEEMRVRIEERESRFGERQLALVFDAPRSFVILREELLKPHA